MYKYKNLPFDSRDEIVDNNDLSSFGSDEPSFVAIARDLMDTLWPNNESMT